jgi:hypothetical protein
MAQTHYSKIHGKAVRGSGVMSRNEYLTRRTEFAPRGQELPHAKLLDLDVLTIRSAAKQRESLRKHIKDNLSNVSLAIQFGVHVRTIEKIVQYETWGHVA